MPYSDSFVASYWHSVPWGVLRVEGVGSGADLPAVDLPVLAVAFNEGCVSVAAFHPDTKVEFTVTGRELPTNLTRVFAGFLESPAGVIEVGDLVGDDFSHRFRVPSNKTRVAIYVDDSEEATRASIVIAGVTGEQP